MTDLLKLSNVSVQYDLEGAVPVVALDHVSLIVPGESYTTGIVGESGSGKTTLGMSIMNVIEPPGRITQGSIEYMGRNVLSMTKNELRHYHWQEVAMVYQSAMNSLNPVKRVGDHITEVLKQHKKVTRRDSEDIALKLFREVGIKDERYKDYPHELSGGMRQRVVIALSLALVPKLLIADEPTSALDVVVQKQLLGLLKREITEKKLSLIFITHEISLLAGLVDNVAVMYAAEIVEQGPLERVLFEPLHPYTEMLLSTLLTLDSEQGTVAKLDLNQDDSLFQVLSTANACKYANRCKYAFDRCRIERPKLVEIQKGRWVACHKYG